MEKIKNWSLDIKMYILTIIGNITALMGIFIGDIDKKLFFSILIIYLISIVIVGYILIGKKKPIGKYMLAVIYFAVSHYYIGYLGDKGVVGIFVLVIGIAQFFIFDDIKLTRTSIFLGILVLFTTKQSFGTKLYGDLDVDSFIQLLVQFIVMGVYFNIGNVHSLKLKLKTENLNEEFKEKNVELENLITETRESLKVLNQVSSEVVATMEGIEGGSTHIAQVTSKLVENSNETCTTMKSTNDFIKEVSQSIEKITDKTGKIVKDSKLSEAALEGSMNTLKSLLINIEENDKNVGNSKVSLNELKESIKGINQVVDTIKDISHKTKLLALNASIESARVGEQGKGFVVVSDEIGKLSERTNEEALKAEDILSKLNSILLDVLNIFEELEVTTRKIDEDKVEVEADIKETARRIMNTLENINNIEDKIKGINTTSSEVETKADEVTQKLKEDGDLIEEIMARIEEESASISTIDKNIGLLNKTIYKLTSQI